MDNTTTAAEIIKVYTANMIAAEPEASLEYVNAVVAAMLTKYLAAAVDPGVYHYYPHPYNEAEAILHNAAGHLLAEVA
jgi:hypothetical protein